MRFVDRIATLYWAFVLLVAGHALVKEAHCDEKAIKHINWDGRPVQMNIGLSVTFEQPEAPLVTVDWGDRIKGEELDKYQANPGNPVKVILKHVYLDKGHYEVKIVFYRGQLPIYRKTIVVYISEVTRAEK